MPPILDLPEKLPQHVAIIMDGNGRWAQGQGKVRLEGHKEGTDRVLEIARACREWGIHTLTLYAFSTENWKRPEDEVGGLMVLLRDFLRDNRAELIESGTRLHTLGDLAPIPAETRKEIEETLAATRHLEKHVLNIALNYGSRAEILHSVRHLAEAVKRGEIEPAQIDEAALERGFYTAGQPDPDLMIRTSGEQRISNYLLWQLAYSEFIFTPVSWPEFGREEFAECLRAYGNRERRFGMTGAQVKPAS